jgi:hypothetical protein
LTRRFDKNLLIDLFLLRFIHDSPIACKKLGIATRTALHSSRPFKLGRVESHGGFQSYDDLTELQIGEKDVIWVNFM